MTTIKIAAKKFIDACNELCKICEIPTLEKYGIDKDEFFHQYGQDG